MTDNEEFKKSIQEIVDLLIQEDSIKEAIKDIKKYIKDEFEIPATTVNAITKLIRNGTLQQEDDKWQEIKALVVECQK